MVPTLVEMEVTKNKMSSYLLRRPICYLKLKSTLTELLLFFHSKTFGGGVAGYPSKTKPGRGEILRSYPEAAMPIRF